MNFFELKTIILRRLSGYILRLEEENALSRHAIMDVEEAERQALYVGFDSRKKSIETHEFMRKAHPRAPNDRILARRGAVMDPHDDEFFAQVLEGKRPVALPPPLTEESSRNKLILFRGDTRPPSEIFVDGFYPKETSLDKTIPLGEEDIGPHRYMPMLRPPAALGVGMDIEQEFNVCFTLQARVACLFPLEASNPAYLYCIYVPSDLIYKTYNTQRAVIGHIERCARELDQIVIKSPGIRDTIEATWASTSDLTNVRTRLVTFARVIEQIKSIEGVPSDIKERLDTIISYICCSVATSHLIFAQEVCAIIPISSDFIAFAVPFEKEATIFNSDDSYSVRVKFQRIVYNERFRPSSDKAQEIFSSLKPFAHQRSIWQIDFKEADPIFSIEWMSSILSATRPDVLPSVTPAASLKTPSTVRLPALWKQECPHIRGSISSTLTECICHRCPDPCTDPTHPHRTA